MVLRFRKQELPKTHGLDSPLLVLVEMPSFQCIEEDRQDIAVEQVEFELEKVLDLHTLLSLLTVVLAWPIQAMTSLAVDPVFLIVL